MTKDTRIAEDEAQQKNNKADQPDKSPSGFMPLWHAWALIGQLHCIKRIIFSE